MNEFNYKEAGKYLASLEAEVENKQAMLEIARATVQSKKQLDVVINAIEIQGRELGRYKELVGIAQKDAEDAEDDALRRISICNGKVADKEVAVESEMDALEDNLKIVREASNEECERLNSDVAGALSRSEDMINKAQEREQDAITKADQAEAALRTIGELAGSVS